MSAFSSIFSTNSDEKGLENVQNMKILTASLSPTNDRYKVEILVVDDSALLSTNDPNGEDEVFSSKSDQISIYVVRQGDTISEIAKMFDVSVNTIKWNNDITSNSLKVGETLVILPISGIKHTVLKGETIASIAKKYKGDVNEIAGFNGIAKDAQLVVGSEIIIPDGEPSNTSLGSKISSGLKEIIGYFLRPIIGGRKTQGIHGHNGIDFGAPLGTKIIASADGQVIVARNSGWNGGYGNYVVIKHANGTQTLYAHMTTVFVNPGDFVKQGDALGLIGRTGKATGVHLHFEIRGAKNPF